VSSLLQGVTGETAARGSLGRQPDAATAIEEHEVFLFDLDGTLAAEGKIPAPHCAHAVARLLESGKHVGVVTARSVGEVGDAASALLSHAPPRAKGRLRFFTSGGALVYGPAAETSQPLELVGSSASEEQLAAVEAAAARLGRLRGLRLIDRGPLLTITVAESVAMVSVRRLLDSAGQLRVLTASPTVLHVLPRGLGKHVAVAHYRRQLGPCASVAIGDGFYEMPEIDVRGNDMDFAGAATTCIQVGDIKPRDPRVLHLPLAVDGPASTARVVELMYLRSTRELSSHPLAPRAAASALNERVLGSGSPAALTSFFTKISEYNATALEPEEADRRAIAAENVLCAGGAPADAVRRLLQGGPLERSFGRWGGFEGQESWVLRWLWDEHQARPGVPFAAHVAERARAPLMPEEIAISLIRALPKVRRGARVVCVGKDAECAVPVLGRLVGLCKKDNLLPNDALDPVGIRVSARKSSLPSAIDGAEHLELGRLSRQLWSLLDPRERASPASPAVGRRVRNAVQRLSGEERQAVEAALGNLEQALRELSLGDLVKRLDAPVAPEFGRFVDFGREILYGRQWRLVDGANAGVAPTVESVLDAHLPSALDADRIAARYRKLAGRSTLEASGDLAQLTRVLFEALGEQYAALRDFEFPFTPVLEALLSESGIRRTLGRDALFVDVSCSSGTTVLFLRALRRIVAPEAEFGFAALGGVIFHEPLQRDLDWSGHAYLPVLLEEGAPHTFDFFYDERDERVRYASLLEELENTPARAETNAAHLDALCAQHAPVFERYRDLAAAGLDFRDLMRWWLRRSRVWEMRVLCDRLRFRWPYSRTILNQQRAIALLHDLDATAGSHTREQMRLRDRDLAIVETRQLLGEWLARHEAWVGRALCFAEQIVRERGPALGEYVAEPTPAAWRRLQRTLMTTLQPASLLD
jgi:hypothetical protein